MAGKHHAIDESIFTRPSTGQKNRPPVFPGSKTDRAYAEGRDAGLGNIGDNPHPAGTPEYNAWGCGAYFSGNASEKLQTAVD